LRLGAARPELRVVDDQHGCPTSAASIAAATVAIAHQIDAGLAKWGTFHFAGRPATTWHGFAAAIFEGMERRTGRRPALAAIPTSAYPTPARRPANAVLDTAAIEAAYGIPAPDWRDDLARVLDALIGPGRKAASA
ncbi:MAG: sugar nucleotide-binding protein, partial [Alphaproteobacteria bacterium]